MPRSRLLLLDTNALVHRAFHALPPLTSPKGEPVGALYGLCLTLLNVVKLFRPTHLAAAFDRPEKTFRHEAFASYKAQREKAPEDLVRQLTRARELLASFSMPVVDAKGYEADDVMGTLTARAERAGAESVIVTGDQDALQLVGEQTRVHLLKRGIKETVTMGPAEVRERYGLSPLQLVDFKALRGDPSDNLPGVRGIGEKTATTLLQQYGSLDGVYAHLKDLSPAVRRKLEEGQDEAYRGRMLATIHREVPLTASFADLAWTASDRTAVARLFQELGFASLLSKLSAVTGEQPAERRSPKRSRGQKPRYHLLTERSDVVRLAEKLKASKGFALDTETNRLGARTQPLHGLSLAMVAGEAWYVPASLTPLLKTVLEDARIPKWGHNIKYDLEVLEQFKIKPRAVTFDTMLASYILAPGSRAHDLPTLAFSLFGHEKTDIESLIGKGKHEKSLADVPLADVAAYSCEDAELTVRLVRHFEQVFQKEPTLSRVFREIEMPLIPVLVHLELSGVKIDTGLLVSLGRNVARTLQSLERRIYARAGGSFNVSSSTQLSAVLFDKLKLPSSGIARTQTGLSTAAAELEKLREAHPIIPLIAEHRELAKLQSTYLDALPGLVDPDTGRVYTTYHQTTTATGRLSSAGPNLQNIPVRTPLGAEIRKAFVAERGHLLVAADYSQLQLRLAAHLARDQAMTEAFRAGADIHAETAAAVFAVPVSKVTKEQRRVAKTLNFGVLYGMGSHAFARAAGVSFGEAQRFIDGYFRTYHGIADYMEEAKALAASQGYVETITGRRRYLPEMHSRDPLVRSEAERMAINHPAQGSEADILKRAMIVVYDRLANADPRCEGARMILTVHDELVFEVPEGRGRPFGEMVRELMEHVEMLSVPLVVDLKAGRTWGTLRALK